MLEKTIQNYKLKTFFQEKISIFHAFCAFAVVGNHKYSKPQSVRL